jgi:hypothetical protein
MKQVKKYCIKRRIYWIEVKRGAIFNQKCVTYIYLLQAHNVQIYVGHATKMCNMTIYARTKISGAN